MNRRDFIKYMGVSGAATAASVTLAKMPEVGNKIILLDKPRDIILAKTLPDVDFVMQNVISMNYTRDENMHGSYVVSNDFGDASNFLGMQSINIEVSFYIDSTISNFNPFEKSLKPSTFTFDFKPDYTIEPTVNQLKEISDLMGLNGRKFMLSYYDTTASAGERTVVNCSAMEVIVS